MSELNPCEDQREKISAIVMRELDSAAVVELRKHLLICPACRELYETLTEEEVDMRRAFQALTDYAARYQLMTLDQPDRQSSTSADGFSMQPRFWKGVTTMVSHHKRLSIAAAAFVIIAGGVLLFWNGQGGNAYAMEDIPKLLRNATTIHVKGYRWCYEDKSSFPEFLKARMVPLEFWVDAKNLRKRQVTFMACRKADGQQFVDRTECIENNAVQMSIDHTRKSVHFNRFSRLNAELRIREFLDEFTTVVVTRDFARYRHVGTETIANVKYDIWENATLESPTPTGDPVKLRCWFSREHGVIGRIQQWWKPKNQEQWRPTFVYETIERNRPIPVALFKLEAPKDYKTHGSAEKPAYAELRKWCADIHGQQVTLYVCFTLDNGSVIVGWSCKTNDKNRTSQIFGDLKAGGKLPALPAVLAELRLLPNVGRPAGMQKRIHYKGFHLAFTKKDDLFIEWSIYLPKEKVIWQPNYVYKGLYRVTKEGKSYLVEHNPVWGTTLDSYEFDHFVRGAMAEFSDDGKAPENITYSFVMETVARLQKARQ